MSKSPISEVIERKAGELLNSDLEEIGDLLNGVLKAIEATFPTSVVSVPAFIKKLKLGFRSDNAEVFFSDICMAIIEGLREKHTEFYETQVAEQVVDIAIDYDEQMRAIADRIDRLNDQAACFKS